MAPLGYFVSIGFFEKYNIPLPRQRYPKSAEKDDPSLLHLKGSATCSWGRIIGTVILSFDLASCLFFLFTVLLVYCISGGSPKTPEEYTTDGGFWLWDLVDTLLPFYTARGIQILTDIAFRCWEDVLFSVSRNYNAHF
ncbi:uncharacterized protein PAC_14544 [Phialocephala subalpina]|uniref:Uncharacterized protein n=1 Tax=Phialocephala subalpina TaxID=576137 RepID=A0A1L7XI69_9HELO|nr:uncharacterized protein PAC_14544 [Phialocephala subalpina]